MIGKKHTLSEHVLSPYYLQHDMYIKKYVNSTLFILPYEFQMTQRLDMYAKELAEYVSKQNGK